VALHEVRVVVEPVGVANRGHCAVELGVPHTV
jgi:hypothetical protein